MFVLSRRRVDASFRALTAFAGVVGLTLALATCGKDSPTTPAPVTPTPPAPDPPAPVTPTPPAPPAPTGLEVSAATVRSITWTWSAVEGVTAYAVQVSMNEVFGDEDDVTTLVRMATHTVSGLDPGTSVYARVASAVGTSLEAAVLSSWTPRVAGMSVVPPVPAGLVVSATTEGSITWTWSAVEGAIAYLVQVSMNEVFGDEDDVTTQVRMPTYRVVGLGPGSAVYFRVASAFGPSLEDVVFSDWSETVPGTSKDFSVKIYTALGPGVVPDGFVTVRLGDRLPNLVLMKEREGSPVATTIDILETTWKSSDPTIMEIGTGEISRWDGSNIWMQQVISLQAHRTGEVTITATFENKTDQAFFQVLDAEELTDLSDRSETDRPDDVTGPQIHAVYVIPADGIDEKLDLDGTISTSLEATRNWMARETGRMLRIDTYDGKPDITFLRLSQTHQFVRSNFPLDVFVDNLTEAGVVPDSFDLFDHSSKVYLIYYMYEEVPTMGAFAVLGGALAVLSSRQSSEFSPSPTAYGPTELTVAHELLHTFGAVESCAPNWIPGDHVSDDHDVMGVVGPRLARNIRVDIDRDDYLGHGREDCVDVAQSPFWEPVPELTMRRTVVPMTPFFPNGEPWVVIRCDAVPH